MWLPLGGMLQTTLPLDPAEFDRSTAFLLQGLAVELQVSDRDEITETEIHDHVISVLTRK